MSRFNVCDQLANAVKPEALIAESASGKGPSPKLWSSCSYPALMFGAKEGFVYFNDFLGVHDPTTACGWDIDTTGSGTLTASAAIQGGAAVLDTVGTTLDDHINAQLKNCMVKPAAGVKIWFEMRVALTDATQQFYFGLAGVCTDIIASDVEDTVDKCGFFHEDGSTDNKISVISANGTSDERNLDVGTTKDATYIKLGFLIDGVSRITYFVNGEPVASCADADDIADSVMCLTLFAGCESAAGVATIDWIRIAQEGGRV